MDRPAPMHRRGGCACGAVRFETRGEPLRVGLCHCLTCRKRHGAIFTAYAAFPSDQVDLSGDTAVWASAADGRRHGCGTCGSPLFWTSEIGDELVLSCGAFDEPNQFRPQYEIWTLRREAWLPPFDVPQFERDRHAT